MHGDFRYEGGKPSDEGAMAQSRTGTFGRGLTPFGSDEQRADGYNVAFAPLQGAIKLFGVLA